MHNLFAFLKRNWSKLAIFGLLLLAVTLPVIGTISRVYQFWDKDPDRGAMTVKQDIFGDNFSTVKYLDQGWKPDDSLWFYTTTQGSNLLPYDFFLALEQEGKPEPFRANENMNRYRYLPQKATFSNPDGLPVGFVKDSYKGKEYMGFTCAACHTGQVNYKGTGIRIDGGPAGSDMETFIKDLAGALRTTRDSDEVRKRFVAKVLERGNFASEKEVVDDLKKYSQRITTYYVMNHSPVDYGYARLDAFGRIYNRVLEHVLNGQQLRALLRDVLDEADVNSIMKDTNVVLSNDQRDLIFERIQQLLPDIRRQLRLLKKIFNRPDAPVSYPFLWDIPQHDYVQWNGIAANAGLGPVGRNTGEVIGVFGTLDWAEKDGWTLSSVIGGQGFGPKHISFESSINVRNLRRIETHLQKLQSPQWPEDIFPPIDKERKVRGKRLFAEYCAGCHAEIKRDDANRRIVAHMSRLKDIGTDPTMADNGNGRTGLSGILRNLYVTAGPGDILIDQEAPVAAILTKATLSVVATPDPDEIFLRRGAEWAYDLVFALFSNEIKPSLKNGNYDPDTTAHPYASLSAYKGRALNGIWATAPYLHNGSVPTLYDLLLPKRLPGDPKDGEYRPDQFLVGSREFDPVKVGLKSEGYEQRKFDTTVKGNSNAGHEYGARLTMLLPDGTTVLEPPAKEKCRLLEPKGQCLILEPLTKQDRWDLLEYLKSL